MIIHTLVNYYFFICFLESQPKLLGLMDKVLNTDFDDSKVLEIDARNCFSWIEHEILFIRDIYRIFAEKLQTCLLMLLLPEHQVLENLALLFICSFWR